MKKNPYSVFHANEDFFSKIRSGSQMAYVSQSRSEEIFNTMTHALGSLLSIIGAALIIGFSIQNGNITKIITTAIYGVSLFFMFMASTLYHGTSDLKRKKFFHTLDHSAIFILIAGTNTPILLVYLSGNWGLLLFIISWALAFTGVFLELFFGEKIPKYISITLYSLMGWLILFAAKPMFELLPPGLLKLLFLGGITFMSGIYFYIKKTLYFNHVIWHLIVLLGTIIHYIGLFKYIALENE
jgi:hemolysin III